MKILLDTNIIIEHFDNGLLSQVDSSTEFAISVITEAELLRFAGMSKKELKIISEFISITEPIPIDSLIAQRAAKFGRTRKTRLPDLFIAATAVEYDLPLFTRNVKDFQRIPGLKIVKEI